MSVERCRVTARRIVGASPPDGPAGDATEPAGNTGTRGAADEAAVERRLGPAAWVPDWRDLAGLDDRLVAGLQATRTDARGEFRLTGLDPGLYEVILEDIPGKACMRAPSGLRIVAPADGIVLGTDICRIAFDVTDDLGPVREAVVSLEDEIKKATLTATDGSASLLGVSTVDYRLAVEMEGYERWELRLPAEGRALDVRVPIRLREAPPAAALVLVVAPGFEGPEPFLEVRLTPSYVGTVAIETKGRMKDGRLGVGALAPGSWKVDVEPGVESGAPNPISGGYLLPETFVVDVEAGAEIERTLRLALGGRIRLEFDGFRGSAEYATIELIAPDRSRPQVNFVSGWSERGTSSFASVSGHALVERPSFSHPNLPAGSYEIRATLPGFRIDPVRFELREGETTAVRITGDPE